MQNQEPLAHDPTPKIKKYQMPALSQVSGNGPSILPEELLVHPAPPLPPLPELARTSGTSDLGPKHTENGRGVGSHSQRWLPPTRSSSQNPNGRGSGCVHRDPSLRVIPTLGTLWDCLDPAAGFPPRVEQESPPGHQLSGRTSKLIMGSRTPSSLLQPEI